MSIVPEIAALDAEMRGWRHHLVDTTGRSYVDMVNNVTGLGHGQSGCLVHELHCESDMVLYKGDCSTWQVEKITLGQ